MKTAAELYPECAAEEYFYGPGDYGPMIESFGTVALQVDDSDYQGDTRVLYIEPDGRVGVLIFGWGSCSGCDALQACHSMAQVQDLIDETRKSVEWFADKSAALAWFLGRDWGGQYSWHADETKRFVEEAVAMLGHQKQEPTQ